MGGAWVFPGGANHADEDADHAATAVRELEEEAGVALAGGRRAGAVLALDHAGGGEDPLRHLVLRRAGASTASRPRRTAASAWTPAGLRPAAALAAHAQDELALVFPTIKHLELLSEHGIGRGDAHRRARAPGGARDAEGRRPRRHRAGPAARRPGLRRRLAPQPSALTLLMRVMRRAFLIAGIAAALLSLLGAAAMADTLIGTRRFRAAPGHPGPGPDLRRGRRRHAHGPRRERLHRGGARQRRRSTPAAGSTW